MIPRFQFSATDVPTFTGYAFYAAYKDAEFLRDEDNIATVLSRGHQLRQRLRDIAPGKLLIVDGLYITKNRPLVIKKSGPKIKVEDHEFTYNRLAGLVAAYAYENRDKLPNLVASEAAALGLSWDNTNQEKCKFYLSAVSGTEHFYDQFSFYPLICALRKMKLNKLTPHLVEKLAKIKNHDGERMIHLLQKKPEKTAKLWKMFPGSTPQDFKRILQTIEKK